jgi:hypothetical protein
MEHRVLVLPPAIEHRPDDEYFYDLICQDFTNLVPFERVEDFNPGKSLISIIYYHRY